MCVCLLLVQVVFLSVPTTTCGLIPRTIACTFVCSHSKFTSVSPGVGAVHTMHAVAAYPQLLGPHPWTSSKGSQREMANRTRSECMRAAP